MRDAKLLQIYEGTNQIQQEVITKAYIDANKGKETGFKLEYEGKDAPRI